MQAVVLTIADRQAGYAAEVADSLENRGFRVRTDLRNEKIGLKIREHTLQRIPYLLVIGDREVENAEVSVRARDGGSPGVMVLSAFAELLGKEVAMRGVDMK